MKAAAVARCRLDRLDDLDVDHDLKAALWLQTLLQKQAAKGKIKAQNQRF